MGLQITSFLLTLNFINFCFSFWLKGELLDLCGKFDRFPVIHWCFSLAHAISAFGFLYFFFCSLCCLFVSCSFLGYVLFCSFRWPPLPLEWTMLQLDFHNRKWNWRLCTSAIIVPNDNCMRKRLIIPNEFRL